jgi:MoxR-like ATPase
MLPSYYTGNADHKTDARQLPSSRVRDLMSSSGYLPDEDLVASVNVALTLGQPLLVTGEPGTGKTVLAYSVASELSLELYRFNVKSTTTARDFFYGFDALRQLRDAQRRKEDLEFYQYLELNALGKAILRAADIQTYYKVLPNEPIPKEPSRSVVLIDEIDKAPRDVPNDLLNEIEQLSFWIPEGRITVSCDPSFQPIVIITSNSEKNLPDPFLRRCIYYNIPFPNEERLAAIVDARIAGLRGSVFLNDALHLFTQIRRRSEIRKRPGTAELLNWLLILQKALSVGDTPGVRSMSPSLRQRPDLLRQTVGAIIKLNEDREAAMRAIDDWFDESA